MTQPAEVADRAPGDGFLILWVAGVGGQDPAIRERLAADGVRVEEIGLDELVLRANRRAPDLVVLGGAAGEAPDPFVASLAQTHPGGSVPIVTLGPTEAARPKPRSRFGLVARLDREAPAETTHKQIHTLLRGLSRRVPRWKVRAKVDDVSALARRSAVAGRCGLLAAEGGGAIAIDADGVLGPDPARVVARHEGSEELALTLHERPPGRVRVLRDRPHGEETAPGIHGARVLVIGAELEVSRMLADKLSGVGAEARAAPLSAQGVHAGRAHDPTAIVVSTEALLSSAVSPLWEEPRLANAALLVVEPKAMRGAAGALIALLSTLCVPELSLRARLRKREAVAERLESLGAARWLKVLGRCDHEVTLRVYAAAGRGRVDLAGGKVKGASFRPTDSRSALVEGRAAVETLLRLPFGRVLAGPPGALARLEGMRRRRRPSMVGLIAPTPASGLRRGEVTSPTDAVPIRAPRLATLAGVGSMGSMPTLGEAPAAAHLDVADEEDGVEASTQSYSAERMAELREQLAASDSASASSGATSRPLHPTLDEEPGALEARADAGDVEDDDEEDAATVVAGRALEEHPSIIDDDQDEVTVAGAPSAELVQQSAGQKSSAAEPSPKPESADEPPDEPEPASASPAPVPAGTGLPAIASVARVEAQPGREGGLSVGWFAGGLAMVLALGGAMIWFVSREPEPRPEPVAHSLAATESTPEPPPTDEPSAEPAPPSAELTAALEEPPPPVEEPPVAEAPEVDPVEPELDAEDPPAESPATDPPAEPEEEPSTAEPVEDEPVEPRPAVEPTAEEPPTASPPSVSDAPEPSSAASIAELIEASAVAARERNYARSEALARRVLSGSPRNAPAAYRLGVALFRQRQLQEALTWATRAAEWDSGDPLPRSLMGDVYMRTGRFHQAAEAYEHALRLSPRFGPARRQLDRLRERGVVN